MYTDVYDKSSCISSRDTLEAEKRSNNEKVERKALPTQKKKNTEQRKETQENAKNLVAFLVETSDIFLD